MALYAFDGTWNKEKATEDTQYRNTNVVRFRDAYSAHSGTRDFYRAGVGTRYDKIGAVLGGTFGLGELPRLNEAYDHLCEQWAAGDHVIDIVGFSRGAATTLDFCHIIGERGIRKPGTKDVVEPRPRIRFLGVWDVVAAFGLANLGIRDFNFGHHLSIAKGQVEYAFHALALDERRPPFLPTRLRGACEVWFRGVHSDIGGGNMNRGLNDITLKWMMSKASGAGLPIGEDDIAALQPEPATPPKLDKKKGLLNIRAVATTDRRHYSVSGSTNWRNPAVTCPVETPEDEKKAVRMTDGLSTMPAELRGRLVILLETARAAAQQQGFNLEGAYEGVLSLLEARVIFVTDDAALLEARRAITRLVNEMVVQAKKKGFLQLNEFFLTAALFQLAPLPPFTD